MGAAFLTTILFSISAVCGRRTAQMIGGNEANFWRLLFAAALLAAYAHTFGNGIAGAGFRTFVISGAIGFGIGDAALFQTLPRLGSRLSVMMVLCLSSPMGGLMEWMWLGTRLSQQEIASGAVILCGVAVALAPSGHINTSRQQFILGILFGLVAATCQALGAVLSRKAFAMEAAEGGVDGITAAYQRILGGVAVTALFFSYVKLRHPGASAAAKRKAWPWVLANGLSGPTLGVSCYQWALKTTPTGVVLPIVALTPIVIIPFARYVEGERPSWRSLIGGAVAVAGAAALALSR
jgi:drug/metabolite transporter (DMT)-like permease